MRLLKWVKGRRKYFPLTSVSKVNKDKMCPITLKEKNRTENGEKKGQV